MNSNILPIKSNLEREIKFTCNPIHRIHSFAIFNKIILKKIGYWGYTYYTYGIQEHYADKQ